MLTDASHNILSSPQKDIHKIKSKFTLLDKQFQPSSLELEKEAADFSNNEESSKVEQITNILMKQTMTALRIFVNDELNELDFGLRHVVADFIKPDVGIFVAIVHSVSIIKYISQEDICLTLFICYFWLLFGYERSSLFYFR